MEVVVAKKSNAGLVLAGVALLGAGAAAGVIYWKIKKAKDNAGGGGDTRAPEVFCVKSTSGNVKPENAEAFAKAFGCRVATHAELVAAQKAGANWCKAGWVLDEASGKYVGEYPMQDASKDPETGKATVGCGASNAVNKYEGNVGVTMYGKKPEKKKVPAGSVAYAWNALLGEAGWFAPAGVKFN